MSLAHRVVASSSAVAVLAGCSLVVTFDRDRIDEGLEGLDAADGALAIDGVAPAFDAAAPDARDPPPLPTTTFLVAVGGLRDGLERADVYVSRIFSDGSLAPWTSAASLPAPRLRVGLAAVGSTLVVSGGAGDEQVVKTTYVGVFASGTVGAWAESTELPNELFRHGSFAHGGRVYVVGGEDAVDLRSDVLVATPSSGAVGAWSTTESLPRARTAGVVVANGTHVYVVSGSQVEDGGLVSTGDAVTADLVSDGGLVGWRAATALPFATNHAAGAATATRLFVSGGYSAPSGSKMVMTAPIDATGALGAWTATSPLITGRAGHSMLLARGRLYVIGGQEKSGLDATSVELADLHADGTLSPFRETAPLPSGRAFIETAVLDQPF